MNESNASMDNNNICRNSRAFRLAVAHEEMNPRKRNTMEDVHRIVETLIKNDDEFYSYFGVYDGHGGRQIVEFLEHNLEKTIAEEIQRKTPQDEDDATIAERLARAFLITDMQSRQLERNTSGATAVIALLHNKLDPNTKEIIEQTVHVANVGDSRAVLVCEKISEGSELPVESPTCGYYGRRLTYDHRAEDEKEKKRVEACGGFITRGRVLGILAVSRSFGDHGMKDFVTADPYITETRINDQTECGHCPMLIVACDGVWDVFSDQEAADFLMEKYLANNKKPFEDAAKMLVEGAIDKGSADNVTAIVIFLPSAV